MSRFLGREGVGNPSVMALEDEVPNTTSTLTVVVIKTSLARNKEEVFHRPMLALKYDLRKAYLFTHNTYVPSCLYVSVCTSYVHSWGRPFTSVVYFPGRGGFNRPQSHINQKPTRRLYPSKSSSTSST